MAKALLGLGSSLGNRKSSLSWGMRLLAQHSQITLVSQSKIFRSVPMGSAKSLFFNQCCIIETTLTPFMLLEEAKRIEKKVGRRDSIRWADRVLDIDILLFANICLDTLTLQIPHPSFHERSFVIQPAQEIAADWLHPQMDCLVREFSVPFPRCW